MCSPTIFVQWQPRCLGRSRFSELVSSCLKPTCMCKRFRVVVPDDTIRFESGKRLLVLLPSARCPSKNTVFNSSDIHSYKCKAALRAMLEEMLPCTADVMRSVSGAVDRSVSFVLSAFPAGLRTSSVALLQIISACKTE